LAVLHEINEEISLDRKDTKNRLEIIQTVNFCFLSFFLGSPVSLGPLLFLILMTIFKRRWVICSKKLLDTKISLAVAIICNCSKIKKVSIRADASFRPKCTTARIATAQQKH
jgi:hypothetical protein